MAVQDRPTAAQSYGLLPFTNGVSAAVYNADRGFIDGFFPHIYRMRDENDPTPNLLERAAIGVRMPGTSAWLSDLAPSSQDYITGTGIVEARYELEKSAVSCWYFCPQEPAARLLTIIAALRNNGADVIPDVSFFLYLALLVGSGPSRTSHGWVEYFPSSGIVLAGGSETSHTLCGRAVRPRGALIRFSSASGPELWNRIAEISQLRGSSEVWVGENLHCVYQGCLGTLPPGESLWAGVVLAYGEGLAFDDAHALLDGYIRDRSARELLEAEEAWWARWQAGGRSSGVESPAVDLHRRSCAVLKMGQCREKGRSAGQIVASLPPGHWNICWVRDAAYSIAGLAAWGFFREARAALQFLLEAEAGYYREFSMNGHDFGVGSPYRISVCRYFGSGREESDGDPPNIELDGFGLFLWALSEYLRASGDHEFLRGYWPTVRDLIIAPLLRNVGPRGIIRPESGPWETHLPGSSFAFTSICAACGLSRAAQLAGFAGDKDLHGQCLRTSEMIYRAVEKEFAGPGGLLLGKPPDEASFYIDAAVIEAVNFDLADPGAPWVSPTLQAFERVLRVAPGRGFCRNNEPGEYNEQEWVFVNLRVAQAMVRLGLVDQARPLIDWVAGQTRANRGLFAELYRREGAAYDGAVPMCGFGAGAFLLLERELCDRGVDWLLDRAMEGAVK